MGKLQQSLVSNAWNTTYLNRERLAADILLTMIQSGDEIESGHPSFQATIAVELADALIDELARDKVVEAKECICKKTQPPKEPKT